MTPFKKHLNVLERTKNLLGVTLSILSLVHSNVLLRHSTQTIFSLCLRGRRSQSTYTERLIPPLIGVETLLPSSNWGGGGIQTHRQEGYHISLLEESRLMEGK
jgi:hypothetical protein